MSAIVKRLLDDCPYDFLCDSFRYIHSCLLEKRIDHDEAELLAGMVRKVDLKDQDEKEEFAELVQYFTVRTSEPSSTSEDISWPEVVGLD